MSTKTQQNQPTTTARRTRSRLGSRTKAYQFTVDSITDPAVAQLRAEIKAKNAKHRSRSRHDLQKVVSVSGNRGKNNAIAEVYFGGGAVPVDYAQSVDVYVYPAPWVKKAA